MNISILTTSKEHPVFPYLTEWTKRNQVSHKISLIHSVESLTQGDVLFLISCLEIVPKQARDKFQKTLVIHASDLPYGRGWSPHIWEVINGATNITLTLLEAEDKVDTGDIWKKINIYIPKTALFHEINQLIFNAEMELMDFTIDNFDTVTPEKQSDNNISYFSKRTPKDSEIDINKSLSEQFDLIRVCDTERFPAFFYKDGQKFNVTIDKDNE